MDILTLCLDSLTTLTVNKLRTSLAILGIVIGIGSVIVLVSLGQASQQAVQSQIQSLGANLLTISPGSQQTGLVRGSMGGSTTLTLADAEALTDSPLVTTIQHVSPEYSSFSQITTSQSNTNSRIMGVVPIYAEVHKVAVTTGTFINQSDVDGIGKVAVVGPTVAETLFGTDVDPIGKTIRINNQIFTIIGVTAPKGGSGFMNQDDIVYVPLSTAQKQLFGDAYLTSIAVEATDAELMEAAELQLQLFMLQQHNISDPSEADFSIFSQQDLINTVSSTTGTFTTLLSGVAAISLLVGGIGIMNIMLVTVTERTREIGLRKALGAKKHIITTQFLIESIILTLAGGLIGVLLGIAASFIISVVTSSPFVISPASIGLACLVSAVIGILFGWYPARRAANLQPIEALRYE